MTAPAVLAVEPSTRRLLRTEMAIVLWSNASSLMLRADNEHDMWKRRRNIDLRKTMETSFRMTIDALLTPAARLEYQAMLLAERAIVHST